MNSTTVTEAHTFHQAPDTTLSRARLVARIRALLAPRTHRDHSPGEPPPEVTDAWWAGFDAGYRAGRDL